MRQLIIGYKYLLLVILTVWYNFSYSIVIAGADKSGIYQQPVSTYLNIKSYPVIVAFRVTYNLRDGNSNNSYDQCIGLISYDRVYDAPRYMRFTTASACLGPLRDDYITRKIKSISLKITDSNSAELNALLVQNSTLNLNSAAEIGVYNHRSLITQLINVKFSPSSPVLESSNLTKLPESQVEGFINYFKGNVVAGNSPNAAYGFVPIIIIGSGDDYLSTVESKPLRLIKYSGPTYYVKQYSFVGNYTNYLLDTIETPLILNENNTAPLVPTDQSLHFYIDDLGAPIFKDGPNNKPLLFGLYVGLESQVRYTIQQILGPANY